MISADDPIGLLMRWIIEGRPLSNKAWMLTCHSGTLWALSPPNQPVPNRPISAIEAKEYIAEGLLQGDAPCISELNRARKAIDLPALRAKSVERQVREHGGCFVDDMALETSPDVCAEALLDALDAGCLLSSGGREGSELHEAISGVSPAQYTCLLTDDDGCAETNSSRGELLRLFESQLSKRWGPGLPSRPQYFLDQALKRLGHKTVRQYARSTTADHALEQAVYAASQKSWESNDVVENVLKPWAAADSGKSIFCADVENLQRHARCFEGVWMVSSSLVLAPGFADFRMPREVHTLMVAGDLRCDARLQISCSLVVGGTIHCGEFYKNAEIERVTAKAIIAERYIYVEYPGEHFVVTDLVKAPLVFFSNVAWECPKIDADVFIPDHEPKAIEAALAMICRAANIQRAEFDAFAEANELEISEAVEEILREGRIPDWT